MTSPGAVAVADIDRGRIKDTVDEITAAGGRAHGIPCDLTNDADSRRIVREAVEAFGGLDIVWNNVGHPGPGRVEGFLMDDYDVAMTLNVRSGLITTTEAIPALRARGNGSIVLIAGIHGSPFSPVYSAAKFGVTGLTKSLSLRLAPDGIRVNCVCPAPIDTPMLDIFMGRPDVGCICGSMKRAGFYGGLIGAATICLCGNLCTSVAAGGKGNERE